ncbi:hypothetical protein TH61_09065 [Rufibacter sp. DG15C]|uniref:hypothetical protein n=1 Tax=Rufibacter sp. DG15C TaxID=1379909 RepID=UPI00078BBBDF|nr:hypothetical protein [Rufibacter sp. DG15C]AMM51289.1 hypothetical protein TH61_09065 [Rufibacter sp. DG15C]
MRFLKAFVLLALLVSTFTSSFAQTTPTDAPKPWVQTSFHGLSLLDPMALQKMEIPVAPEQKAMFHSMEAHMGNGGDYMIYSMYMHAKTTQVSIQGSLQGAIQNAVTQLQGTDFQIEFMELNQEKSALLATATFTRGTDKMIVKGYGFTDQKGKAYIVAGFGEDNLKMHNTFTRLLTSIKVQ